MSWARILRAVAERFGRSDEAVDRHHAGGDLALDMGQVAVARDDHVIRGDGALPGADGCGRTTVDGVHLGAFVDHGTRRLGGEGEGVAQRVVWPAPRSRMPPV